MTALSLADLAPQSDEPPLLNDRQAAKKSAKETLTIRTRFMVFLCFSVGVEGL